MSGPLTATMCVSSCETSPSSASDSMKETSTSSLGPCTRARNNHKLSPPSTHCHLASTAHSPGDHQELRQRGGPGIGADRPFCNTTRHTTVHACPHALLSSQPLSHSLVKQLINVLLDAIGVLETLLQRQGIHHLRPTGNTCPSSTPTSSRHNAPGACATCHVFGQTCTYRLRQNCKRQHRQHEQDPHDPILTYPLLDLLHENTTKRTNVTFIVLRHIYTVVICIHDRAKG